MLYINSEFKDEQDAAVSPFDRGFLYGDGIFETLKADRENIEFLGEHITRLEDSAQALNITVPDTDWNRIILELLKKNGLSEKTARVKIILTRGTEPGLHLNKGDSPTLIITASEQKPEKKPEKIGIYPEKRLDPVSKHKSLNYLYNLQAREWAKQNGFDEAVLLGSDGEILECAASNIFIERDKTIIKPLNQGFYLEGIVGNHFCNTKKREGFLIKEEKIFPEDIKDEDTIYITNSMIGICPVRINR